jgi:hypothetical protein
MQVRVEADPVAERLDGADDAGNERLARRRPKVDRFPGKKCRLVCLSVSL